MKQFRLPALMISIPVIVVPIWYILNTDTIGTWLFGEKLMYCNVLACHVTRVRFELIAVPAFIVFILGVLLLLYRCIRSARESKSEPPHLPL